MHDPLRAAPPGAGAARAPRRARGGARRRPTHTATVVTPTVVKSAYYMYHISILILALTVSGTEKLDLAHWSALEEKFSTQQNFCATPP